MSSFEGSRRALATLAVALSAACSDMSPATPCDCKGGTVCVEGTCLSPCHADADCGDGHACVPHEPVGYCDPVCDPAACKKLDKVCGVEQTCVESPCKSASHCDAASFCEVATGACYALDGSCDDATPCPLFAALLDYTVTSCDGLRCRVAPPPLKKLEPAVSPVDVVSPRAPGTFATEGDIRFEWTADDPALVFVLSAPPPSSNEVELAALWGATAQRGVHEVHWSDGQSIFGGIWLPASRPAPTGVDLYLYVMTLKGGDLTGASALVPFRVGRAWPRAGDACDPAAGSYPGDCATPAAALACVAGRCAIVCGSAADCSGAACDPPNQDGVRLCGVAP